MAIAGELDAIDEPLGETAAELGCATGVATADQPGRHGLFVVADGGEGSDIADAVFASAAFAASCFLLHLAEAPDLVNLEPLAVEVAEFRVLVFAARLA